MSNFYYKGLSFTEYHKGNYTPKMKEEAEYERAMNREPPEYFAFYGSVPMRKPEIMERVDQMEKNGVINYMGMYGLVRP